MPLTRVDLLDSPITVDDMVEYVKAELMHEAGEHRRKMYGNGQWAGSMSEKQAVAHYAEFLMESQSEVELCEEWFLKNR